MRCLVTILCVTYNQESYIKDALEGFVMQKTDFKYKVIVHDDASTDGTTEIVKEYQKKYPDLIFPVIQKENIYSRDILRDDYVNPLIEGKYMCLCEGDDYWIDEYKLAKQVEFLENNKDYCICSTSTKCVNVQDDTESDSYITETDKEITLKDVVYERNGPPHHLSSMMFKKEIHFDSRDLREKFGLQNIAYSLTSVNYGKIWMLHDVTSVYRFRAKGSWSLEIDDAEFKVLWLNKRIDGFELFDKQTENKYHKLVQYAINKSKMDINLYKQQYLKAIFGQGFKGYAQTSFHRKISILYEAIWYGVLKHKV